VGGGEDRAQIKKNIAMGGVHRMDIFLERHIILQLVINKAKHVIDNMLLT